MPIVGPFESATPTSEPIFSTGFERWWRLRVPDVYRLADAEEVWTLKRWLAGLVEQQTRDIETLRDRIDYIPPSDRVGEITPLTTGEDLTLFATDPAAVLTGSWALDARGRTAASGPSSLSLTTDVEGGRYDLGVNYRGGPDRGIADLYLDDSLLLAFDEYAASVADTSYPTAISVSLDHGFHTFRLEWTGTDGGLSTGQAVDLANLTLVNTSNGGGSTSDLVDPVAADDAWLDWLGQLRGVVLGHALSLQQRRDAVRFAASGLHGGTRASVQAAAATVLTGAKFVQVYDHSTDTGSPGTADEWSVLIVTRASETPDPSAVVPAVVALDAKPAGVMLYHRTFDATWAALESAYPTWADWEAAGTWGAIEETGLI